MRFQEVLGLSSALCLGALALQAQETNQVEQLKKQLEQMQEKFEREQQQQREQLEALRKQIELLQQQRETPAAGKQPPETTVAQPAPPETAATAPALVKPWSPTDPIRLLGAGQSYLNLSFDALFAAGGSTANDIESLQFGGHDPNQRGFTVQNVETTFEGKVDPYFRGQAAIIYQIDPEGESFLELEEAYAETLALPWNLQVRGGQFFTENQNSDKMYLLVEGEVSLVRGKKVLDVVKAGEVFGEMAAISQLPRSATAVGRTDCRALSLDSKQFQSAIQKASPEFALMLMNIIINRLRLTGALVSKALAGTEKWHERRVFDAKLLAQLVNVFQNRLAIHAPLNKVIMKEGEGGIFLYIVLEGRVAISIQSNVVERIGPGGIFGEMALVDQSPRAATATAETDCSLLSINRGDFLRLVKTNPAFGVLMLRALAERLRYMTSHHK